MTYHGPITCWPAEVPDQITTAFTVIEVSGVVVGVQVNSAVDDVTTSTSQRPERDDDDDRRLHLNNNNNNNMY